MQFAASDEILESLCLGIAGDDALCRVERLSLHGVQRACGTTCCWILRSWLLPCDAANVGQSICFVLYDVYNHQQASKIMCIS